MGDEQPVSSRKRSDRTATQVKNWIDEVTTGHVIDLQRRIVSFLLPAYGFLLGATMVMFFLQGFKVGGFQLDCGLLKWLGGATIGAIAGLLTLTFGAVFKGRRSL